ncbi:protein shisa-3 homolog isoform X2 [Gallus gallus]|uniref:protein shisa-3 homolog isoform X2 n=1 Tax=Gallus gallus TaxID=9031 RepID=UPI001F0073BB|nr:protein shisa-3 homolog isoform X2 [Gallus gallus]
MLADSLLCCRRRKSQTAKEQPRPSARPHSPRGAVHLPRVRVRVPNTRQRKRDKKQSRSAKSHARSFSDSLKALPPSLLPRGERRRFTQSRQRPPPEGAGPCGAPRGGRAHLCPVPHRRVNIYCLHHRGLPGGCLLLHVPQAQAAIPTHPLLPPELPDRDSAHDPALVQLPGPIPAVQHGHQLQLGQRLPAPLLPGPRRAGLLAAVATTPVLSRLLSRSSHRAPGVTAGLPAGTAVPGLP